MNLLPSEMRLTDKLAICGTKFESRHLLMILILCSYQLRWHLYSLQSSEKLPKFTSKIWVCCVCGEWWGVRVGGVAVMAFDLGSAFIQEQRFSGMPFWTTSDNFAECSNLSLQKNRGHPKLL